MTGGMVQHRFDFNSTAPVEDALRSVPHEFDTRRVSMNLDYPAAIDQSRERLSRKRSPGTFRYVFMRSVGYL